MHKTNLVLKTTIIFNLVFGCALPGYAQNFNALSPTTQEKVEQALSLSGANEQIQAIPESLLRQLQQDQQQAEEFDDEVYTKMISTAEEIYRADRFSTSMKDYFAAQLDETFLNESLSWYQSALGRKVVGMEVSMSKNSDPNKIRDFAEQMKENPLDSQRVELVNELNDTVKATELAINLTLASFKGIAKALSVVMPEEERMTPEEMKAMENELWLQMQEPMQENTILSFLYTYQNLTDEELQSYIDFCQSDAGLWFNNTISAGMIDMIAEASDEMGAKLQGVFKEIIAQEELNQEAQQAEGLGSE
ncbi:MAG: hypothetical protein KC713_08160 [Candidatus Omnitrophica bacterium]|nr:hypothetical protein [Candidatus Omnitrophota bacterium]